MTIVPIILCGGSGTRLWPVSRKSYPKQFSKLLGDDSLFQQTVRRVAGPDYAAPIVLTNAEFRFIVAEQLSEAGSAEAQILIEPLMRNTAPAVLTAALSLQETPDAVMLVAPSDHVISDLDGFGAAVEAGAAAAERGQIVCFGVTPDRPETGYGWLELDEGATSAGQAVPLRRFVEKPDLATAETMLSAGNYLWNAGIFMFRVRDILAAYNAHASDLVAPCTAALEGARADLMFLRLGEEAYAAAPSISIDYAIMERVTNISAACLASGWNDLGAWDAVWRELDRDGAGVAVSGPVTALECRNSLLRSEEGGPRLVGVGLSEIAAIATRDAVLVAPLEQAQQVKEAVAHLKEQDAPEAEDFPRCFRPWGWYETLARGPRFQVKQIMVKPGGRLSLQSHHHRAEHWVVVRGTAEVTVEGEVKLLSENESVFVPLGAVHRLANPGQLELHLIEVQSGPYLGEDDIVRYDDIYARK